MKVRNRSASVVGYRVPDLNVRRRFVPGEVKEIPVEELQQLLYQTGGRELLTHYLQVSKDEIKQLDMIEQEREYFYTDDQIKQVILHDSYDKFLDVLDFAPEGVINLIKKYALELPMTDLYKIKALQEKTGFDVTRALENSINEDAELEVAPTRKRRVEDTPVVESKYRRISE